MLLVNLIALNDAKSSHLTVTLQKEIFTSLRIRDDDESFSFKLAVKPLCMTLKHLKGIDGLNITIMMKGIEHLFNMDLGLINGIKRKHKFHYTDVQSYNVVFQENDANYIKASPQTFARILEHIPSSPEINIYADHNNFKVQSHSRLGSESKKLSTELCIKTDEFDEYVYRGDDDGVCIIFTIKEMKALLGVCEAKSIDEFYLFFTSAGSPIKFSCRSEFFSVSLVQMTISDNNTKVKDDEKQDDSENISNSKEKISEPMNSNSTIRRQSDLSQSEMSGKISNSRKRERKRVITINEDEDEDDNGNEYNEFEYNDNE